MFVGHVCGVWQLRSGGRGQTLGLLSVWTVLPSLLCQCEGQYEHHSLLGIICNLITGGIPFSTISSNLLLLVAAGVEVGACAVGHPSVLSTNLALLI